MGRVQMSDVGNQELQAGHDDTRDEKQSKSSSVNPHIIPRDTECMMDL